MMYTLYSILRYHFKKDSYWISSQSIHSASFLSFRPNWVLVVDTHTLTRKRVVPPPPPLVPRG
jgi:hypothetical protein